MMLKLRLLFSEICICRGSSACSLFTLLVPRHQETFVKHIKGSDLSSANEFYENSLTILIHADQVIAVFLS